MSSALNSTNLNNNLIITPDFTRQFVVFLFIVMLIMIVILVLYYNITKKITNITEEIINSQTRNRKMVQNDIIPLFNDYEEILYNNNILNDNLIETYILYVYFENLFGNELWLSNFYAPKNILRREDGIKISYKPDTNQLLVTVPLKKLGIHSSNSNEEELNLNNSEETIIVKGIKQQKWLQIAVIINGRDVDIYIDKKLRKSQLLDNVPILSNNKFILGEAYKNANCYIGKIEYSSDALTSTELKALYARNMRFFSINAMLRDSIYYQNQIIKESIYSPS
tara:strand:+ start:79 stop:921 length:843 start_codon:yes stop_codon:yes gene_type:complete